MFFLRTAYFRVGSFFATAVLVAGVAAAITAGAQTTNAPASQPSTGSVAKGKRAFMSNCTACHSTNDENRATAPSLHGVIGRRAGTREGYAYSPAMKDSKLVWDDALLEKYLAKPDALFPGTPMTTAISLPVMRADLVAYVKTLVVSGTK